MASWLGKDFDRATRSDIERLMLRLQTEPLSEWTRHDYRVAIRKFYKVMEGGGREYPEKVAWIRPHTIATKHSLKLPEEVLTPEEVRKLIQAAEEPRERAFVAALWESGARIGEFLALRLKHVELRGNVVRLGLPRGERVGRYVALIESVPYLAVWLEHHPGDGPDCYLWCRRGSHGREPIGYATARKILRTVAVRAGVRKACNPHAFRHARATYLARHLTEAQMKQFFGWVQSSRMAAVYVHLSARDIEEAILRLHGLAPNKKEREPHPEACPRCGFLNPTSSRLCQRCGLPFEIRAAFDTTQRADLVASVLSEQMIDQIASLVVRRLLEQRLGAVC